MVTIRRSLFDLETQHERAYNHYKDEIKLIRSELAAIRQSGTAPVSLGIPARSPRQLGTSVPPPNTPSMASTSQVLRHCAPERDVLDRELRDRRREILERDLDRVGDQRDMKRHKTQRDYSGLYLVLSPTSILTFFFFQVPQLSPRGSSSDAPIKTLEMCRLPPNSAGSSSSSQPGTHFSPATSMADELKRHHVPSGYLKDGGDWCAVYNPQVKKALDINLVHTFFHAT